MKTKHLILAFLILVAFLVSAYFVAVEIKEHEQIKLGNELIANIKEYQSKKMHLPENGDWGTLKKLGFSQKMLETSRPEYLKVNDDEYQLIFVEGFDPPYLLYSSVEKEWKRTFPKMYEEITAPIPFNSRPIDSKEFFITEEMKENMRVIEIAEQAILFSIENMNKPEAERDPNFPTNKYNIPFVLKEKEEFDLQSCTFIEGSDICTMEFTLLEDRLGPRFVVEFNQKEKKALCVYMKADA